MASEGDTSGFFTVRIPAERLTKFPSDFEARLRGRRAHVRGTIGWYQGDPHIVVASPDQIRLLEEKE